MESAGRRGQRALATSYPTCTSAGTKLFLDNLNAASSGCATSTTYTWDGSADPTDTQRTALCKCTVSPFDVPKCSWTKQGQFVVSTSEHFNYAYNCSGKTPPKVTEVDVASSTTTSTPAPTPASGTTKYGIYDKCTPAGTKQFVDSLNAASNGCTTSSTYNWGGDADPDNTQRAEICKCAIAPLQVPKCSWEKETYNVSVWEHFNYVYKCDKFGGKPVPAVTEVAAALGDSSSTSTDLCSSLQIGTFTTAIKTASGCLGSTSYNWGGTANPTDAQYSEICKCSAVADPAIPSCSVMKGPDKVSLSDHFKWVLKTQCPKISSTESGGGKKSSNVGMIAGIAGGVVAVVLIIGFFLCKRNRKAKSHERSYQSHDMDVMRSPVAFNPMGSSNPYKGSEHRPSGISTIATTISTANGNVSHGTNASTRSTETGKWDDPVIQAVRIPYDSIFFGTLLSRGGFGEVYRGTCRGETVAIKQLLPERRKDLVQIDDFLSEVKLMSSLEHERIVKFIGVAWNSLSDACMVVEFMENGDLRSVLGRWDTPGPEKRPNGFDADKVKIALHVAHALVYLHSLQPVVVHRDLKSKNVLLDANLDAKLTDFGISRERADSTMTAGVGSSLWMAPEVMMGSRYDEKADIFSFGVVLSELDTHQLPYFHAKVTESGQKLPEAAVLQQVMLGRISVGFTDRADPELVQLGRECVNVDPKQRPTTAQVLHRVHQVMRQYK